MEVALPFLVSAEDPGDRDAMGGIFRRADAEVVVREIPVAALRKSLQATVAGLRSLFEEALALPGPVRLREAQVGLEVSASGGIQLIGTAQAGIQGAITLVFRQD